MSEDEAINEEIARLVDSGALVVSGMHGDEFTYNMVPEIMKVVSPVLYEMMMEEVNETLLNLYEDGLVDIDYDENLVARFSITEEGAELAEKMLRDGYP